MSKCIPDIPNCWNCQNFKSALNRYYCADDNGPKKIINHGSIHPDCPLPDMPNTNESGKIIKDMLEDMKSRIDSESCNGYKTESGAYVYPISQGIFLRLMDLLPQPPQEGEE